MLSRILSSSRAKGRPCEARRCDGATGAGALLYYYHCYRRTCGARCSPSSASDPVMAPTPPPVCCLPTKVLVRKEVRAEAAVLSVYDAEA